MEQSEETPRQQEETPSALDTLRSKVEDAQLPHQVMEAVTGELKKLEKTDSAIAEYSVGFNYIELVLSPPLE